MLKVSKILMLQMHSNTSHVFDRRILTVVKYHYILFYWLGLSSFSRYKIQSPIQLKRIPASVLLV